MNRKRQLSLLFIETAGDVLDAAASPASAHEEKLENMQEEIDSSAQERPDASPTNQETVAEGSGQASEGAQYT